MGRGRAFSGTALCGDHRADRRAAGRAGGVVQRQLVADALDIGRHRRRAWHTHAGGTAGAFPCATRCRSGTRTTAASLGLDCDWRQWRRGGSRGAIARSWPIGTGRRGSDRRQPASGDLGQPARCGPVVFLCRYPERPDRGLYQTANRRPGCAAHRQRTHAARRRDPDQRQARQRGCGRPLGRARRPRADLCRGPRRRHGDHRGRMVGA